MADRDDLDQLSELVQGDLSEKNRAVQLDQSLDSLLCCCHLHVGSRWQMNCDQPESPFRLGMDYNRKPRLDP